MAKESICRNCFHSYVCEQFNENKDDNNQKCHFFNDHYVPAADVVPKSEVEELKRENESLAKTVNDASELIRKLRSKIDELKKDRYQVLPDGRIELLPRTDVEKIKTEVAREIFEAFRAEMRSEIKRNEELFSADEDDFYEGRNDAFRTAINYLAELKEKYTGEKSDG